MALTTLAAWLMASAFALSTTHEVYQATAKAGVLRYDSMRELLTRTLPFYLGALVLVLAMGFRVTGTAWAGLALAVAMVLVSALYYNPTIMAVRQPGMIDWAEDVAFTGLFFASAVLLTAHLADITLAT
ncbi:MAG: hypothetical protein O2826_05655 [Chloroflexi bacterium]|nr:hypothetical protein [Chloroflexota bacterium]MDA1173989.1 hypothetical protein [Chloroflexota bacterium]